MPLDRCSGQLEFDVLQIGIKDAYLSCNIETHGWGFLKPPLHRREHTQQPPSFARNRVPQPGHTYKNKHASVGIASNLVVQQYGQVIADSSPTSELATFASPKTPCKYSTS